MLMGCEKESVTELHSEEVVNENVSATTRSSNKRDVCHNGNIINININAIPAHQAHGDAVDMDGDGFFDIDNPCSETDCDDNSYSEDNSCGCIEGELEIDFNGSPLFVAPFDEGIYTWQDAIAACNAKDTEGCDWFLPTKDELLAVYQNLGPRYNNNFNERIYWSSTPAVVGAWVQNFEFSGQGIARASITYGCRCVRR